MSDISDLEGIFAPWLRWSSEVGMLGRATPSAADGRGIEELPLGTNDAKWVFDMARRQRGYGKFRKGFRDAILTPVGTAPPQHPGDPDYKPMLSIEAFHPSYGEHVFEASASNLMRVVSGIWDQCRRYEEFYRGLQPVWFFADRYERPEPSVDKIFWLPVIEIIGWIEREKLPFHARPVTVPPPSARPSLEDMGAPSGTPIPLRQSHKPEAIAAPKAAVKEDLDDEVPSFATTPVPPNTAAEDVAYTKLKAAGLQWLGATWLEDNGIAQATAEALVMAGKLVRHPTAKTFNIGLPELLATENGDFAAPSSSQKPPANDRSEKLRARYGKGGPGKTTDGETPTW